MLVVEFANCVRDAGSLAKTSTALGFFTVWLALTFK